MRRKGHFLHGLLSATLLLSAWACKQRTDSGSKTASPETDDIAAVADHFSPDDIASWQTYLESAETDPIVIQKTMEAAAKEFGVPAELLMAIGQYETNWTNIGPSIDRGWGMMHLVENHYADTLNKAAGLIQVDKDEVRTNMRQNIRGMAALLADAAGPKKTSKKLEDWFDAVKAVTGLSDDAGKTRQALNYYAVLQKGVKSPTIFGTTINIKAIPTLKLKVTPPAEPEAGAEYPDAVADYIPCNFSEGRKDVKVDTWTNHYIAVGSVEGARSWFKNCSAQASAHFLVSKEGQVYQFRPSTDTTWHAGSKYNNNFPNNNRRSIGVEHEVLATHPEYWQREELLNASTKLANFYINKYGIPRNHTKGDNNDPGIRGHQEMPGTSTDCPGPLPWEKWFAKLNGKATPSTPAAATGKLIGIVYRGDNRDDRIGGASVKLNTGATATADARGVYEFKNLADGKYTVSVTVEGSGTKTFEREIKGGGEMWGSISF